MGKANEGAPGGPDRGATAGAAFLMATSAIGPGFLTQTAVFTDQLGADFAFVILASVALALVVQVGAWRVLGASGRRAPELAQALVPGLGPALVALVVFGGLVFNVGNVAGCSASTSNQGDSVKKGEEKLPVSSESPVKGLETRMLPLASSRSSSSTKSLNAQPAKCAPGLSFGAGGLDGTQLIISAAIS